MKAVVFDYNRTLYDPETDQLVEHAREVLEKLVAGDVTLFLIAKGNEERKKRIETLGLSQYFQRIIVNESKSADDYCACVQDLPGGTHFFAVGDRVKEEIKHANLCGMTTIWFRCGKFANEEPQGDAETPTYTITDLSEVSAIVLASEVT